ncbi:hypothetical protein GCM10027088_64590 [Nocardia goodfellowii]|uniref:CubicO group peptidase (Beta-lactamase class C family) n=1 Tax=Nocardia goodfellowii TaxID=882446 RepID=A0ABS4QUH7_9NOCA|nr:CubicO group peptidase (beta-lactamase class C family) [Nocardia goodfellowii]
MGTTVSASNNDIRATEGDRFSVAHWQERLDTLRAARNVPGAALAVLVDGHIHELASGLLHRGTGVEVTTDSVFLCGSIAKVYTATLIMQLVDEGKLDLDAPVIDVLPEFAVPDAAATEIITTRQLLSHTAGLTNDFNYDSGRGDDCLAEFVKAAREVPQDCPTGTTFSYGGIGYVVMGRMIEVLTGLTWDQAVVERLARPLGLERTVTLPEQALKFRTAMSHLGAPGLDPDPAPEWDLMPRSVAPAARIIQRGRYGPFRADAPVRRPRPGRHPSAQRGSDGGDAAPRDRLSRQVDRQRGRAGPGVGAEQLERCSRLRP